MAGWTAPRSWVTSEVDTAAFFNAQLRDNMNALISGAHAYQALTPSFAVGPGATTAIPFTGIANDPLGMWSSGSPTRITVPIAGTYRFVGRAGGDSAASWTLKLYKNGVLAVTGASLASGIAQVGEWDVTCVAADYLELRITAGASPVAAGPTVLYQNSIQTTADLVVRWSAP